VIRQDRSGPPSGVDWPESFEEVLKYARPSGGRPRQFDYIAQLGADNPHINYPLRHVGEADYEIKLDRYEKIGNISVSQAIREAYPGANYLHLGHSYKVLQWMASSFERCIRLEVTKSHAPTKPIQRKRLIPLAPAVPTCGDEQAIMRRFQPDTDKMLTAPEAEG
jgi:DEAD/DEAH box helicase domain-containing protein